MTSRDERIEALYQESAWYLAERVVALEDAVSELTTPTADRKRPAYCAACIFGENPEAVRAL